MAMSRATERGDRFTASVHSSLHLLFPLLLPRGPLDLIAALVQFLPTAFPSSLLAGQTLQSLTLALTSASLPLTPRHQSNFARLSPS